MSSVLEVTPLLPPPLPIRLYFKTRQLNTVHFLGSRASEEGFKFFGRSLLVGVTSAEFVAQSQPLAVLEEKVQAVNLAAFFGLFGDDGFDSYSHHVSKRYAVSASSLADFYRPLTTVDTKGSPAREYLAYSPNEEEGTGDSWDTRDESGMSMGDKPRRGDGGEGDRDQAKGSERRPPAIEGLELIRAETPKMYAARALRE